MTGLLMDVPGALGAVVTACLGYLGLVGARRLVALLLRRMARRTATPLDDHVVAAVAGTNRLVLLAVAAWLGAQAWLPDAPMTAWAARAAMLATLFQVGAWTSRLVVGMAANRKDAAVASGHAADATAWTAIAFLSRLGLWSLLSLVALDNLGVDVTALIAGLGVGGLAIGLAVQNVLGDLLASMAIVLDRPFSIGDFLVVGDVAGTVEHVGLKTTRVRALSGEEVVLSNADVLGSRIRNYRRMTERRVVLSFGVLYETPPDALAGIPALVREQVEAQAATRFDRAHLFRLGESSMDFEAVYYLGDPDYNRHMDTQQAILLGLVRRFEELGIGFAYPTRTLYVRDAGGTRPSVALAAPGEVRPDA